MGETGGAAGGRSNEKNLQFFYDYRAVNGYYIYGGRKKPFGVDQLPGRVRQAAQDDREPRPRASGPSPGQARAGEDRRQLAPASSSTIETNFKNEIQITSPEESAAAVHPAGRLRGQPVRLRGRVPRTAEARAVRVRLQGPAVGRRPCRPIPMYLPGERRSTTRS